MTFKRYLTSSKMLNLKFKSSWTTWYYTPCLKKRLTYGLL